MKRIKGLPILGLMLALFACGKESQEPKVKEVELILPKPLKESVDVVKEPATSSVQEVSDPNYSNLRSSYAQCLKAAGGSDASMLDCIHDETEFQDKQLNASYKRLLSLLDAANKSKLVLSQKAWLAFVKADEDFNLSATGGGTSSDVTAQESYLLQLAQRVKDLNSNVEMVQSR